MKKKDMLDCMINYYTDGNKAQFASKIGVKPQTINSWLMRDSFDAELIYSKCEGISPSWLLSGKGEMLFDREISKMLANKKVLSQKDEELVALSRELVSVIGRIMSIVR